MASFDILFISRQSLATYPFSTSSRHACRSSDYGITGFATAHIALSFLKHGWTVHGTLRSDAKRSAVEAIPEYAPYLASGQLKLFEVGPLESADHREAIKGVESVAHPASPVEFGDEKFRETHLKPALEGTLGVLRAVGREGSVKSVVYTSSFGLVGQYKFHPTELKGRTMYSYSTVHE
ncbi:hypothetical protein L198_06112 [Cryptococcus wingfieldii CBS 7118]|uniref:3-beta hydroxysteroid dehydrogenase/isomerase domain-containing protein n=1 Tax=Cryptococcus wingfieldii CBS 7118 TaxID=1295528 RepID=A0A1E3IQT5_9TREE|nr:hypothetical protein L198_06112 [Cryptococcus wingfieldii CBS 7118]ODN90795.1 hypothetical protein L198_06112 [Cryptococcus wingfieldii CBS 7118]